MSDAAGSRVYSYRRLVDSDEPIVWRMLYEAAHVMDECRLAVESVRDMDVKAIRGRVPSASKPYGSHVMPTPGVSKQDDARYDIGQADKGQDDGASPV